MIATTLMTKCREAWIATPATRFSRHFSRQSVAICDEYLVEGAALECFGEMGCGVGHGLQMPPGQLAAKQAPILRWLRIHAEGRTH